MTNTSSALLPADQSKSHAVGERRSNQRARTVYRVARVHARGDMGLARIHNISDDGMMLTLGYPVALDDRVEVELTETLSVDGSVVWHDGVRCGIKFVRPIDTTAVLRAIVDEARKGSARALRLPIRGTARSASQAGTHRVSILDVSQRGMKLAHNGSFTPGLAVKISTDWGVDRRGVVRWSRDGIAGLILSEPFTIEELGSIRNLQYSRASSGTLRAEDPSYGRACAG